MQAIHLEKVELVVCVPAPQGMHDVIPFKIPNVPKLQSWHRVAVVMLL
jgi:hypothetical protein